MEFIHSELIQIAERWLLNTRGCGFVLKELPTAYSKEIPDVIGFRNGHSILIECKATRSDFLSDKRKSFRKYPQLGMGLIRLYMAPTGVISPDDLPSKWGLIEVNERGKAMKKRGPRGNAWTRQTRWMFSARNTRAEYALLISALRRVHLRGDLDKIYDPSTIRR
jgi:hypothetical protein